MRNRDFSPLDRRLDPNRSGPARHAGRKCAADRRIIHARDWRQWDKSPASMAWGLFEEDTVCTLQGRLPGEVATTIEPVTVKRLPFGNGLDEADVGLLARKR